MSSAVATIDRGAALVAGIDGLLADLAQDLEEALCPAAMARSIGLVFDPWQERLVATTKPQVIVLCGRQSGKTSTTAFKAIHCAITEPRSLILILSPGDRQSILMFEKVKDMFGQLGRPVEPDKENEHELKLANGSRIVSLPGKGDTVRGFSAPRLVIIDEASRTPQTLYDAVRPMLATSPHGQLFEMSTPAGKRGFFYRDWLASDQDPTWERIGPIVSTEIPRIPSAFLERERKSLPDLIYKQEYHCEFVDEIGAVFSFEQIARALADETIVPRTSIFNQPVGPGPLQDPSIQPRYVF